MGIFLAVRLLLPKIGAFFGALLKNKFVQILLALFIAALIGAAFVHHKDVVKYDAKITKMQTEWKKQEDAYKQEVIDAKSLNQKVNTVVVTQWKTKVQTIVKHEKDIDTQIDASNEIKDEDRKCSLGPDFVRLWNLSTTESGPAASPTSGTAQSPATPASSPSP